MTKIAHLADVHIRPYKYLDEMKYTFERLYENLSKQNVDLIVIVGDIFHSKLTPSHEYFEIASDFLQNLIKYGDVLIIPGNHDISLTNKTRQDAIYPIVKAINSKKITYSKHSEAILYKDNVVFHHFSLLDDKSKWPTKKNLDLEKINIALYHGTINGVVFDNGWISRGNKDDISLFDYMNICMLGDIHKHQFLDADKRIAYAGSLRQNNFSEDVEKGYLLWDIESKDDFKVERIILPQMRYFFTLYGNSTKDVNDVGELPEDCRIRFQLTEQVDPVEELKIVAEIEKLYKPCGDVIVLPPQENIDVGTIKVGKLDIVHENIRLPESQIQLLKEYFKNKSVDEKDLKDLIELDKKFHSYIDSDVVRNVTYKLQSVKWDNMFSYGKDNIVNFGKLRGLVGLFGDNWVGKSSIMDTLTLGVFNQIFKEGANKSVDYVNRKCKNGLVDVRLTMNNKCYDIKRTFKKRSTKTGEDKCDIDVNFAEDGVCLNGETRPDTNKIIRNKFGTDEDFAFTSLSSQFNLMNFINSRGTKRKEILAKYFDLDIFDTKYQVANEELKKIKNRLDNLSFSKIKAGIDDLKSSIEKDQRTFDDIMQKKNDVQLDVAQIDSSIYNFKQQLIQGVMIEIDIEKTNKEKFAILETIKKLEEDTNELKIKICSFLLNLDSSKDDLKKKEKKLCDEIREVKQVLEAEKAKYETNKKAVKLLETIPNVEQCRICPLSQHAFESNDKLIENKNVLQKLAQLLDELQKEEEQNNYGYLIKEIEDFERNELKLENKQLQLQNLNSKLNKILDDINQANAQEQNILKNQLLNQQIFELEKEANKLKEMMEVYYSDMLNLTKTLAVNKEKLIQLEKSLAEVEELSRQKYLYDLYLDAMGKNGISYWIISKKMPIINKQVNFILSQCVPFKLLIENNEEEKSIKIYIVDKDGRSPIELGSGAEKTISSIALRAALWNICLLPKTPILILDEAFACVQADKFDGVVKLLTYLKSYFDAIIVITHDESLKMVMDDSYHITRNGKGYSCLQIN